MFCGSEKNRCCCPEPGGLFGAGVFGDGFRALADGVLGQLAGQQKSNGRLDLPTGDRRAFVVVGEARGFRGNSLEDVVDERIHDRHGLRRDAGVRMYLLQYLVDVDGVALLSLALLFLVALRDVLLGLAGFFRCFSASFRWHFDDLSCAAVVVRMMIRHPRPVVICCAANHGGYLLGGFSARDWRTAGALESI